MRRPVSVALLLASSLAFPSAALADKKPSKGSEAAKDEDEGGGSSAKPAADAGVTSGSAPAPAADPPKVAAYVPGRAPFPRISDNEETIYAVQRKAYLVNHKIEVTPMLTTLFADRFVQSFAPAGSVAYHIAENFALEVFGSYMFPTESSLTTEILKDEKLTPEVAKLTQMLWAAGVGGQWSPIYGKLQAFGLSLGNFGFFISAGIGIGQTRVTCVPGLQLDPNQFPSPTNPRAGQTCPMVPATGNQEDAFRVVYEPARTAVMGTLGGGIDLYFSNVVGLKIELKDWVFPTRVYRPEGTDPTQRYTDAIRNNVFLQVGIAFLFGGEGN